MKINILSHHETLCEQARAIMVRKNQDYASQSDPFKNFRGAELLGVNPVKGILLRMHDKLARIANYIDNGTLAVKDESVSDCCHDLINYSVLLHGLITSQKPATPAPVVGITLDEDTNEIDG